MPVAGFVGERGKVPDGIRVAVEGEAVRVAGPKGTLARRMWHPRVRIAVGGGEVRVRGDLPKRKEKANGKGNEFLIENLLGERHPRKAAILADTTVTIEGDQVVLQGPDLEAVGQTAANIERATKIQGRDPRVFQDGVYIV